MSDDRHRASRARVELAYEELRRLARRHPLVRGGKVHADALAHDAFLRVSGHEALLDTLDRRERTAWAARVLHSAALDRWRREIALKRGGPRLTRSLEADDPADTRATAAASQLERLELRRALLGLGALHPGWLLVLVQRDLFGRSCSETARILGWSETAVKRRRRRGLAWLRRRLRGDDSR